MPISGFSRSFLFAIFISLNCATSLIQGQNNDYKYFYRVYFKDKGENNISDYTPSELFTHRAIIRREKNGITGLDLKDLPVSRDYLYIISSLGLNLHCTSRWMNTALFKSVDPADVSELQALPFVENVKCVKRPVGKGQPGNKFSNESFSDDVNPYLSALLMVKGDIIHNSGYEGSGKLIAVMDGGFKDLEKLPAFENLRARNGIINTYDFVERNHYVYDYHVHGSDVMCILAGDYAENVVATGGREPAFQGLTGSAREADYLLLRTEDTFSEYPAEQDFWAAAAEFADSAGCEIITSSLGYYRFDDPSMDYKYYDMDGKTAFITLAAEIAVSRGIVVVNSAGNEGSTDWKYIIAPSDGAHVIAVGAVDGISGRAPFSSQGPTSDGRLKPDVMAQGVYLPMQRSYNEPGWGTYYSIVFGSGTSYSCPVISGMIACLMQAVPEAGASDIISTIREVSDRYNDPDSLYGYGIPDFARAVTYLQRKFIPEPEEELSIGPNPFKDRIRIFFKESPELLIVELLDSFGNPLFMRNYLTYISLSFELEDLQNLKPGMYYLRLTTARQKNTYKLIKAGR